MPPGATVGLMPCLGFSQATVDLPTLLPSAVVDLRTSEGAALVRAEWRYGDVRIVETDHREPGPDLRPTGAPNRTHDITPHAGPADFDDSSWEIIEPASLESRRSHGRLAFGWYRTRITLPPRVGDFDVTGSTIVLELVIDDYAEIWVDGQLPVMLGQTGGQLIKGFNAPNRVILTHDARPGQQIQLAIFGANGGCPAIRERHRDPAGSGAGPDRVERCSTGKAGWRIPVHRRPRVASGRLPPVQRSQRQHDLSLVT